MAAVSNQAATSDKQKIIQHMYGIADTMGCTMFESTKYKDEWTGCKPRQVQVGPWSLSLSNAAWSDQINKAGCSAFLKIKGDLWAYVISEAGKLQLVLFDGKALGINRQTAAEWGQRSIKVTLLEIEPFATAWFTHDYKDGWKKVDREEF